jgi:hypothetical protein
MLGITIVLLALTTSSFVAVGLIRRRRFIATPGTFRCKLRLVDGQHPGLRHRWPLRTARGRWVHGVLLHLGPLGRISAIEVRFPEGTVERQGRPSSRIGRDTVALVLRLDDDALVELSAPSTASSLIVGPFLAAAIAPSILPPSARTEQPGPRRNLEPPGEPR